jgi:restriction system protein
MSRHRYRRNRSANLFGGIAVLCLLFYFIGFGRIVFWLSIIALVIFLVWVLSQRKTTEKVNEKNSAGLLAPEAETAMGVEQPAGPHLTRNLLNIIEWFSFEQLCLRYFKALPGIQVEKTSAGADGGVDIVLHSNGEDAFVQCKQRERREISVKIVREFYGVMASKKITKGMIITTSSFTPDAIAFAKENHIRLVDGDSFWAMLDGLPPEKKREIEDFLAGTDYVTPRCPNCEVKLVKRENRRDGSSFWGCPNYPHCRYTLQDGRTGR